MSDLGYTEVDVAIVDLGKEDEKALNIALNKIGGEWDDEKLAAIFAELQACDYDISLTGFDDDAVAALVEAVEDDPEPLAGEVHFTEVLREEHNYIVLYFDNEVDWLQAESLFALETVKALSTRTDGKITASSERRGVGRVLNGPKALEVIRLAYKCELPEL